MSLKLILIVLVTAVVMTVMMFTVALSTTTLFGKPLRPQHQSDDLLFNHSANEEDNVQKRLSNVFFSIKSTAIHDFTRLPPSVLTWLRTVPTKNVNIITDDSTTVSETIAKLDDDMYVNTEQLEKIMLSRDHNKEHYLGRTSYGTPFTVHQSTFNKFPSGLIKTRKFHFATGAIYCLSKKLMSEIEIYVRGTKLAETSKALNDEDDVTVGFVVEAIVGCEITIIVEMNSQYNMNKINITKEEDLKELVTISYNLNMPNPIFNVTDDPTRFFSYHCALYPTVQWCQSQTLPKLAVL